MEKKFGFEGLKPRSPRRCFGQWALRHGLKRKKSILMIFFSFLYPACSVCVTIYPLYLVLLISFSLISWFGNSFLQVFEKKENKDLNHSISKPKLFKVIPHCLRICSRLGETQIRRTKLHQIYKIWLNFHFKQALRRRNPVNPK